MAEKAVTYTIKTAAQVSGLSEVYIRRAIQTKKLPTLKVQIEGTEIFRHEIKVEDFEAWRNGAGNHTVRTDGRNKFVLYANPNELAKLNEFLAKEKLGASIEKANKPEDVKRRYLAQKARKVAAKAQAKAKAPVAA